MLKLGSAAGFLKNVTIINLSLNRIGNEEFESLFCDYDPAASTFLPSLRTLNLERNGIGNKGLAAFSLAVGRGALRSLHCLQLEHNLIDDDGIVDFCCALDLGALPSVRELELAHNPFFRVGVSAVRDAILRGGLLALSEISFPHEAGEHSEFMEAVESGLGWDPDAHDGPTPLVRGVHTFDPAAVLLRRIDVEVTWHRH